MSTVLITAPTLEPVSLEELKDQLRIDSADFDSMLTALITEGRRYVEEHTGRALITQTWDMYLDALPTKIHIPYPPLSSITYIKYQDLDNAQQTLASTNYTVDTKEIPARVYQSYGGTYPNTYPDLNAVVIRFIAGFGSGPEDVPEQYKQAIKMYCQWMYDQDKMARGVLDQLINQSKVNWF